MISCMEYTLYGQGWRSLPHIIDVCSIYWYGLVINHLPCSITSPSRHHHPIPPSPPTSIYLPILPSPPHPSITFPSLPYLSITSPSFHHLPIPPSPSHHLPISPSPPHPSITSPSLHHLPIAPSPPHPSITSPSLHHLPIPPSPPHSSIPIPLFITSSPSAVNGIERRHPYSLVMHSTMTCMDTPLRPLLNLHAFP